MVKAVSIVGVSSGSMDAELGRGWSVGFKRASVYECNVWAGTDVMRA